MEHFNNRKIFWKELEVLRRRFKQLNDEGRATNGGRKYFRADKRITHSDKNHFYVNGMVNYGNIKHFHADGTLTRAKRFLRGEGRSPIRCRGKWTIFLAPALRGHLLYAASVATSLGWPLNTVYTVVINSWHWPISVQLHICNLVTLYIKYSEITYCSNGFRWHLLEGVMLGNHRLLKFCWEVFKGCMWNAPALQ